MIEGMMTAIGVQMLLVFSGGLVSGLIVGAGYREDKIVEQMKKADAEGKSLKYVLKELTDDDDKESGVVK